MTLRRRQNRLRAKKTKAEIAIADKLGELNIQFIEQKAFISGNYYCFTDFYLPKPFKLCIEVDGPYHSEPIQQQRDQRKDAYLKGRGFKILRITNQVATTITPNDLLWLINAARDSLITTP